MKPVERVAHSIYSSKGVYALLLGSGISRPAQIPTGWEILLELLARAAHLSGEEVATGELPTWFRNKFSKEPTYSNVLEFLAATPSERSILIREFFERKSNNDEDDDTVKQPTKAHRAIARMVRDGYFKVLVTTNFDRLTEQALAEVGITPSVIASEDDVSGALPLVHSKCTLIKVNGDYLDARIRNTSGELLEYGPQLKSLLERVFDEFGILIIGWSGDWDEGLKNVIQSVASRRFTTFWGARSTLSTEAKVLADARSADVFEIIDADSVFERLEDSVGALESLKGAHPVSSKMAVASLKKYLAEDRYKIKLHDLVIGETNRAIENVRQRNLLLNSADMSGARLSERLDQYDSCFEMLYPIFIHGSYWSTKDQAKIFQDTFQAIMDSIDVQAGYDTWIALQRYPAFQLLVCATMAAIKGRNFKTVSAISNNVTFAKRLHDEPRLALYNLYSDKVMSRDVGRQIPGYERRKLPASEIIFARTKKFTGELAGSEGDLQVLFDKAEYLLGLKYAVDFSSRRQHEQKKPERWGPFGSFLWKLDEVRNVRAALQREIESQGVEWGGFKDGLFACTPKELLEIKSEYDYFLDLVNEQLRWQ